MGYVKAGDVLPPDLVAMIQRYVEGCTLYVPKREDAQRRAWGAGTGAREALAMRDAEMRAAYRRGANVDSLAQRYGLSVERVRRIVYGG